MSDDLLVRLRRAGALLDSLPPAADPHISLLSDRPRRRSFRPVVAAAALLLFVGGATVLTSQSAPISTTQLGAPSDAGVELPAVVRFLPTEDGWTMVDVAQMAATRGEVSFAGRGRSATLTWSPTDAVPEPRAQLPRVGVGGFTAFVGSYDDHTHMATWEDAGIRVVLLGDGAADEFTQLLQSLRQVDTRTWNDALPTSAR